MLDVSLSSLVGVMPEVGMAFAGVMDALDSTDAKTGGILRMKFMVAEGLASARGKRPEEVVTGLEAA